jgi:GT2 family glycosyltransferase
MPLANDLPTSKTHSVTDKAQRLSLVVAIATRGRAAILKQALADRLEQSRPAEKIFVAYVDPSDIEDAPHHFPQVHFIQGPAGAGGSCAQRNRLLDAVGDDFDLIVFTDDDCFLHRDYLLRTEQVFLDDADVLGATGRILFNGARGPGLSVEYARSTLRAIRTVPTIAEQPPVPAFNTDGCNMAFRVEGVRRHGIHFDEQLPAYAWYEDIDFSRRLLPFGPLVLVPGAQCIHLGAKVGKTSGKRFGYSQIANPIYLARKGTFPWSHAWESMIRHLAANLLRSFAPEPYIDRRGRLRGNVLALWDVLCRRMRPDRILGMQ